MEKSEDSTPDKNKLDRLPPKTDAGDSSPRMNDALTPCVLIFNVWDTGIGIPLEKQERVFDSFPRQRAPPPENMAAPALVLPSVKEILLCTGMPEPALVSDSREVMNLLATHRFQFVLMDLKMPHLSGLELLAQTGCGAGN